MRLLVVSDEEAAADAALERRAAEALLACSPSSSGSSGACSSTAQPALETSTAAAAVIGELERRRDQIEQLWVLQGRQRRTPAHTMGGGGSLEWALLGIFCASQAWLVIDALF